MAKTSTTWLVSASFAARMYSSRPIVYVKEAANTFADDKKCGLTPGRGHIRIRSITARAAARTFIRNNLATLIYLDQDGANTPTDLHEKTSWNAGKPRREAKYAKAMARSHGEPIIRILK